MGLSGVRAWKFGESSIILAMASLLMSAALYWAYVGYLSVVWRYYGFAYSPPGLQEWLLLAALVIAGAMAAPKSMASASNIVLLLLFVVVYIPTVLISLCVVDDSIMEFGADLIAMCIGFLIMCWATRMKNHRFAEGGLPGNTFDMVMVAAWAVCCLTLVIFFRSNMNFVGFDDIYVQRELTSGSGAYIGYVQSYFGRVLSPALIALGLAKSRRYQILLGSLGCLIMYMISAEKMSFFMPFALIGLYKLMTMKRLIFRSSFLIITATSFMIGVATYLSGPGGIGDRFMQIFVFRALALPGLTLSQYQKLFGDSGYTWWSNVKGLDIVIQAPSNFARDSRWPNLGRIVGDRVYHTQALNANANLFAWDGAAAAGAWGILVISLVAALWLYVLNRSSRGWNVNFVVLVLFPVGLTLTNGSLFTTLFSFGGLFWIFAFLFFRPMGSEVTAKQTVSHDQKL